MALSLGSLAARLRPALPGNARSLLAAMAINAFGAGMFFPFALLYYQAATSLSVASIGVALTSATLVTLAMTPATGAMVDRFGARRLVVISQCVVATGFAGYLMVSSSLSLVAAALVATAGQRMFYASFSTLIAESVDGGERDHWYGLVGVIQSIGASASGFLASLLIGSIGMGGFRTVIAGNICCLLVSAALVSHHGAGGVAPVTQERKGGYATVLRDRPFLLMVISNAFFIICSMMLGVALAVYATEAMGVPLWAVGATSLFQTALVVGLQTRVIERMQQYRRTRAMLIGGFLWTVACLLFAAGVAIPASIVVPYLFIGAMLFSMANLMYTPAARSLASNLGPAPLRGRYIAIYELSWGGAAAVVPAFFGVAYSLAPFAPWLVSAALVVGAMGLLWCAERAIPLHRNRPVAPTTAPRAT